MKKKKRTGLIILIAILAYLVTLVIAAVTTDSESVINSGWSLVPPIVAIALALITKEVYSSLFIGILTGALLYSGFNFTGTLTHVFSDGMIGVLSDASKVGILIFLVILGMMVQLMNRAGGSAAFGEWASRHIKTRAGAQLATIALGILIFIDDYFNCLTVGSVMRPVTDRNNVSRAKLAYLIDATAAPVCIIAPISSWAAAVNGFVKGENGMVLFLSAIPFNYYALLTIAMMIILVVGNIDYGPMAIHEDHARHGDLYTTPERPYANAGDRKANANGKIIDMLVPIISLIVCCVIGMIYTGGFFSGKSFIQSFEDCDSSLGLVLGSAVALLITLIFYLVRRVLPFKDCMDCLPEGFKQMVSPILILTFAWTLKAMTDSLGADVFVTGIVQHSAQSFQMFLPFIIFLIGVGLSFATGTSWGTFGILIPIVVDCFPNDHTMMIIAMSACMAGAVCGDHCSPISDTTIMSSAGAQCLHLNHVSTQLPYAMTCAAVSAVTYIVAGITRSRLSIFFGLALLLAVLLTIKRTMKRRAAERVSS